MCQLVSLITSEEDSPCMDRAMDTVDCFSGTPEETHDLWQYLISKC